MSQVKPLELDLQLDLRTPGAPVGLIRRGPQQMRAILVPSPPRKPIGITVSTTEFPELSHICNVPALLLQVAGSIDLIDRKMPTRSGTVASNFDSGHQTLTVAMPADTNDGLSFTLMNRGGRYEEH